MAIKDQMHGSCHPYELDNMEGKELIFYNNQVGIQECKIYFFKEAKLVSLRVKASMSATYDQWIQQL
jgi:hypothetical protein